MELGSKQRAAEQRCYVWAHCITFPSPQPPPPGPARSPTFLSLSLSQTTSLSKRPFLSVCDAVVLHMAAAHPLHPVEVRASARMGVQEMVWRRWVLSMTAMLLTQVRTYSSLSRRFVTSCVQDSSLLAAVLLWRDSLQRHFEGVECCPICYAVFHAVNNALPSLPCKTCRNKYHSSCLYKWFNTSNTSNCPMVSTSPPRVCLCCSHALLLLVPDAVYELAPCHINY